MKEFKNYHPAVNLIYFAFVIGFSVFFMHPACLLISFVCGFLYSFILNGYEKAKKSFLYLIPLMIITALINPLFNHEGVTVLSYFPSGNPLTLESILYGICASLMLVCVILWFSCFNEIMTSDKLTYLFGRIIPSLSLVFSMTLRFVPRFSHQFKAVLNAQKCMGHDVGKGSILKRIKIIISVISVMITWSFENAIETADSMKARGYGLCKRTAFSIFTVTKRDITALIYIIIMGIYILFGAITGGFEIIYFPSIKMSEINSYIIAYLLSFIMPVIIEFTEVMKWKSIK